MHKLVLVLWDGAPRDGVSRRQVLMERCVPALQDAGVRYLSVLVRDDKANVPAPSPFPLFGERATGLVNAWVEDLQSFGSLETILHDAGFRVAGYRVEPSTYSDYGDNVHAKPRSWPDGTRSPGVTAVSLLERPRRLDRETWIARWHGVMSPVSEAIQPRTRYVRNLVLESLSQHAPPFEGIVEESWPSAYHVRNPFLFYGARGPLSLLRNVWAILVAVTGFLTLWRVQTSMMSEWFVHTPWPEGASDPELDGDRGDAEHRL